MCGKKNIAFVGSTLPYRKVRNLIIARKLDCIICSTINLYNSYLAGFQHDNINIKIYYLSDNRILNLIQLVKWVAFSKYIYIFHECCWRNLDLILLGLRKDVIYSPDIGLLSREPIYNVTIKTVGLKLRIFKKYFDYYRAVDNLILGDNIVLALKPQYRKSVEIENNYDNKNSTISSLEKKSLIILGMDGVENFYQEQIFYEISNLLIKHGYRVDLKDHPNKEFRLLCNFIGTNYLNPLLPAECLVDCGYKVIIGFSSAAMALDWNGTVITIAKLLPQKYCKLINLKLAHINSLNFKYYSIKKISELEQYL